MIPPDSYQYLGQRETGGSVWYRHWWPVVCVRIRAHCCSAEYVYVSIWPIGRDQVAPFGKHEMNDFTQRIGQTSPFRMPTPLNEREK